MGAGDFKKETFDKDELAALGEVAPQSAAADKAVQEEKKVEEKIEKKEPESKAEEKIVEEKPAETGQQVGPTAEEKAAAEKKGYRLETDEKGNQIFIDEDGEKIPPKRVKELWWQAKEGERIKEKLDLLKKLGPEEFFDLYPDEKPPGWTPPQREVKEVNPLDLQYSHPGHEYNGKTLREIAQIDPDYAMEVSKKYYADQQKKVNDERESKRRRHASDLDQSTREATEFASIVSSEKFGKDISTLTVVEAAQINDFIRDTYIWGVQNKKLNYSISDMWILKQRADATDTKTKQDKALKALEKENKAPVLSIGTGGGSAGLSGFEAYLAMSEENLTSAIGHIYNNKELRKFFKDAPEALRKKHPNLPWD